MKKNLIFENCSIDTKQVQWLLQILEAYSQEDRALFMQFVCGTSKIPVTGFKDLSGGKFKIEAVSPSNVYPKAHTCFNQIDLPMYETKEQMEEILEIVIRNATDGYGFN